ncbi:hypothetical protein NUACC21_34730 [Scytonema sp. NUACC21]
MHKFYNFNNDLNNLLISAPIFFSDQTDLDQHFKNSSSNGTAENSNKSNLSINDSDAVDASSTIVPEPMHSYAPPATASLSDTAIEEIKRTTRL